MAIRLLVRNIALTANVEKPYQLPYGCKSLQIQCRTAVDVKMGTSQGAVEGATAPGVYFTIKSGTVFSDNKLDVGNDNVWIYLAAASGVVAELVLTFDDSYTRGVESAEQ